MSRLAQKLESGQFVVTAELGPPQSASFDPILRKLDYFRGYVDAVNVTDNQAAIARMSSSMVSALLVREGLEPVMQLTCRDRNRLALQSEVLSAGAAGIGNILCLTGDHQRSGNQPDAKGVFDLDSTQLVHMVSEMSTGFLMNGDPIACAPQMFVGAAANPFGEPFQMRVWNVVKKRNAGARFFQTQPVFDVPRFERWFLAVQEEAPGACILPGVMPIKSIRALSYMQEKVPGLHISDAVARRIEAADDPAEAGIRICSETIDQLRQIPGVCGIHLMPVMWESVIPRLVAEAGLDQVAAIA